MAASKSPDRQLRKLATKPVPAEAAREIALEAPLPAPLGNQALQHLATGGATGAASLLAGSAHGLGNAALQRLAAPAVATAEEVPDLGARIRQAAGRGQPLGGALQRTLESRMNTDLSSVRVHADTEADALTRAVHAEAFTTGSDIFFKGGNYRPESPEGFHMLAHEATHVVQQRSGPVAGTPAPGGVSVSSPADPFERAAVAQAERVAGPAPTAAGLGVQRAAEDEELQAYVQRAGPEEEEEAMQGFVQRAGEEDALQMYVQRAGPEEEEPVQG